MSYAPEDRDVALQLRDIITAYTGDQVWMRDFDLFAGDLVSNVIDDAVVNAKWFVVFLSANSIISPWVQRELNMTTTRAMMASDFRVVGIRLDAAELSIQLQLALQDSLIDVSMKDKDEIERNFMALAELIDKTITTRSRETLYVDRGSDGDRFSLTSRRNQIVFVLGLAGIGKSSFVKKTVSEKLSRRPMTIELTRGHSEDRLAREIIKEARTLQPLGDTSISKETLVELALDAVSKRANDYYVFIDDAEEGLDASNYVLPYFERFLEKFIKRNIDTRIVVAITRRPEYSALIASNADVFRLGEIDDVYIREYIDLLLEDSPVRISDINGSAFDDTVQMIGGYPLVAKIVASQIKFGDLTLSIQSRQRIQLSLAQHILRAINQEQLSEIQHMILQILAVVQEPMSIEDMMAVKVLQAYSIEQVQQARFELVNKLILDLSGEYVYMHRFLVSYFQRQLEEQSELMDSIARDYGKFAFDKALSSNQELLHISHEAGLSNNNVVWKSNEVLRYAIPAGRLLRSVGEDALAERLPVSIEGVLREMVFFYYQTKQDNDKALYYAEKWLRLNPDDLEVMLYQARSYRRKRIGSSLQRASKIIEDLERKDFRKRFTARLYREKALLAEYSGNLEEAKELYRKGIEVYSPHPYPENYIGLAQLLLRELEDNPLLSEDDIRHNAREAKRWLEEARRRSSYFDRLHLGLYAEALIQAGFEDRALPLLHDALDENPDDSRLNYRLAEIYRKKENYKDARFYAENARRYGATQAVLSLANIIWAEVSQLTDKSVKEEQLNYALQIINSYRPKNQRDEEVIATITAKLYRGLGNWYNARRSIQPYLTTGNPYTLYEAYWADLAEAQSKLAQHEYGQALLIADLAIQKLEDYKSLKYSLPLVELLESLVAIRETIKSIID
nr:TIR domain-containing protein [Oscillochloris sp. ZM17-4]